MRVGWWRENWGRHTPRQNSSARRSGSDNSPCTNTHAHTHMHVYMLTVIMMRLRTIVRANGSNVNPGIITINYIKVVWPLPSEPPTCFSRICMSVCMPGVLGGRPRALHNTCRAHLLLRGCHTAHESDLSVQTYFPKNQLRSCANICTKWIAWSMG